jgi:hypothetical protein
MQFFSGFCFQKESELFESFTCKGAFCISGFSYGAIKAFEYALHVKSRVDKLQLFSPAFFQDKDEKFKKLQTISFQKNQERYIENFLSNVCYPSDIDIKKYLHVDDINALKELLHYVWDEKALYALKQRGVEIEVYLGSDDKIIDASHVKDFFQPYATVYFIKNTGHILR